MMSMGILQLLLLLLILWLVFGRKKGRKAYRSAADDTIPYPTRQLDSGRTGWISGAGMASGLGYKTEGLGPQWLWSRL